MIKICSCRASQIYKRMIVWEREWEREREREREREPKRLPLLIVPLELYTQNCYDKWLLSHIWGDGWLFARRAVTFCFVFYLVPSLFCSSCFPPSGDHHHNCHNKKSDEKVTDTVGGSIVAVLRRFWTKVAGKGLCSATVFRWMSLVDPGAMGAWVGWKGKQRQPLVWCKISKHEIKVHHPWRARRVCSVVWFGVFLVGAASFTSSIMGIVFLC